MANNHKHLLGAYDGWLAYTQWEHKAGIDTFLGSFSTPKASKSAPTVLYIFTGLQDDDWVPLLSPPPKNFDILQPVTQLNSNGWAVRSWYVVVDGSGTFVSPEVPLQEGDVVFGNMTRTGSQTFFCDSVNTRTQQHTHISVTHDRLKVQDWAFTTVECYGCTDFFGSDGCDYLPTNELHFTDMSLTAGSQKLTPSWKAFRSPNPVCDTTAHIKSPTAIDYTFQK